MRTDLDEYQHHKQEIFTNTFGESYPKEKSFLPEIIQINKRISFLIKEKDYPAANKLYKEIERLKKKQHDEYINEREKNYTLAYEKFKYGQEEDLKDNEEKIQQMIFEYNIKYNKSFQIANENTTKKESILNQIQFNEEENFKNVGYTNKNKLI